MKLILTAALLLAGSPLLTRAADLGIEAPPLQIQKWIKGDEVKLKDGRGTNVFVVEFWATWCGPCRESIPHMTDLQKRFKDRGVVLVGISDETEEKVKTFLESMGDKMAYRVALDDARKTHAAYMEAFKEDGIPHAFVVDQQGRVAWHGHPMIGLDSVLEDILEGSYDIEAARRAQAAGKSMEEYFDLVAGGDTSGKARTIGERIVKDAASDPAVLNAFAWDVLTNPRLPVRDFELAHRAAKTAYERTQGKDVSIIDTYARALFLEGKPREAVALQKKAIELCPDDQLRPQLEKSLREYEAQLN